MIITTTPIPTETHYTFDQLDSKVQQRLIEEWCKNAYEIFETEPITEMFSRELEGKGYDSSMKLRWSLSYSQGDGVAFYGVLGSEVLWNLAQRLLPERAPDVWLRLQLVEKPRELLGLFDVSIEGEHGRYHHGRNMYLEFELDGYAAFDDEDSDLTLVQDLEAALSKAIEQDIVELSQDLEELGYAEIEYQTGEERAREDLEQHWFDEDGEEQGWR